MRFIKIANKGAVHRFLLEIIGLGTKQGRRDDVLIVGQYHSGFKLATPAAIRSGLKVVASSNDTIGSYILNLATKKIDFVQGGEIMDAELLCYRYSDGREVDLSIALTAFPQWEMAIGDDGNKTYPILREYIANARDEDKNYTLEFGITNTAQSPAGHTAVYVEETEEVDAILKKYPGRYFKFMGAVPLFAIPDAGAIYPKSSEETRFFNQGYLVGCKNQNAGWHSVTLYDYDIYGKDIVNEIRTIREQRVFDERLAEVFCQIRSKPLLLEFVDFACREQASYETGIFGLVKQEMMSEEFRELCREIWREKFPGEDAVLSCGNADIDAETKLYLKCRSVNLPRELKDFFKKAGIKDSKDRMIEFVGGLGERPLTGEETALAEEIKKTYFSEIEYYRRLSEEYSVAVLTDKLGRLLGRSPEGGKVLLGEACLKKKDIEKIIEIYTHELRHCETKKGDLTSGFMSQADWEVGYLLRYGAFYRHRIEVLKDKLRELGVNPDELFSEK